MTTLGETAKLIGSPIQRRMKRIEAFKRFVSSHRKHKTIRELTALFSLEFGIRKKVAEEYLQLLLDSGFYWKHRIGPGQFMLLSPSEYKEIKEKTTQNVKMRGHI